MSNEELVERIQEGTDRKEYLFKLWEQNTGLVAMVARKYSAFESMDDLMQQGFIGLYMAAVNYNPDRGAAFATYASIWIRESIQRYIEDCSGAVRIPCGLNALLTRYGRLSDFTRANYGRMPTDTEIMDYLDVSRERRMQIQAALSFRAVKSLNEPVTGDSEDLELYETVAGCQDVEADAVERVWQKELSALIWGMVERLPEEQSHILKEHYLNNRTIADIGREKGEGVNVTRDKERRALKSLRYGKGSARLKSFIPESMESHTPLNTGLECFKITWTSATEREAIRNA